MLVEYIHDVNYTCGYSYTYELEGKLYQQKYNIAKIANC